ncbi:30S ribosomal protein S5 [Candidatus Jorgensenbacteria bacterium RIFCSPLOWO2_01_FULL_45_25b]|uniref:Small ribosomal subunit protein uS5 n=1 Tax=Candidatus Jorgensenbacteria bacterium RIFCSPLOWO2_01_FULL_45_25b TaxID=1798471 RepID=A0A1F6BVD8_9BACT|nr:MAG: 30S ribosomal protein S5 [Candidatus Jorgensenbacteria bacterium RIFCSPLOWO2_01_FULL_45_25b]
MIRQRPVKPVSQYDDKVIEIRRVSRVVKGGKRFSFRATVVVGNRRGKVGVGIGKGLDVASAVEKAKKKAESNIFTFPLKQERTIPYDVEAKYDASRVRLKPTKAGHGLIAGGSCRTVLDLSGVRDISAKILGRTKNKLTNAMATIEALKKLKSRSGKIGEEKQKKTETVQMASDTNNKEA